MIVFSLIAFLAHREKKKKKRAGQLTPASSAVSEGLHAEDGISVVDGSEKKVSVGVKAVDN